MRDYFESPGFKDKLMSGNMGGNQDYYDDDEYEYYDDDDFEDYDHLEREDLDGEDQQDDKYSKHGEDL